MRGVLNHEWLRRRRIGRVAYHKLMHAAEYYRCFQALPPGRRIDRFISRITRERPRPACELFDLSERLLSRLGVGYPGINKVRQSICIADARPSDQILRGVNESARARWQESYAGYLWGKALEDCKKGGHQVVADIAAYKLRKQINEWRVNERHVRASKKLINQVRGVFRETSKDHG